MIKLQQMLFDQVVDEWLRLCASTVSRRGKVRFLHLQTTLSDQDLVLSAETIEALRYVANYSESSLIAYLQNYCDEHYHDQFAGMKIVAVNSPEPNPVHYIGFKVV